MTGRSEKRRSNQKLITMYNKKVKSGGVFCYCKTMLVVLVMCLSMHLSVRANNVRLNGTVKVTDVTSGVATLELDLTWDNSWRDNFNWDAVWLFLKYKPASGAWSHVMLQNVTHTATNDYVVMNGNNSTSSNDKVVGVYVFLGKNDTRQQASTKVTLKWTCPNNYTKADFDENRVFLLAQGVEMVYIPFGAYYLGDGASYKSFAIGDTAAVAINSEDALTLSAKNGMSDVSLAASYPKGYAGFYVMKYETSQEQYVTFLNTLTRAQQETLLGSSFLSALSPGRYIFGDTVQVSYRNGIVLSAKPEGKPYVFDNNLSPNAVYGEDGDGQCVACNYMSLDDVLGYASWAGLRPMSELEYERACRAPFPQTPKAREYVWNDDAIGSVRKVSGLNASGKETEVASSANSNVNYDNGVTGPVRCGLFAKTNTNQADAGATYWGVMEMAGNVRELVAAVSHTSLNRTANGNGVFDNTFWTNTPILFGLRGGGFSGADSLLRTSDRSEMTSVSSAAERNNSVGFRLVRTLDAGSATVNAGAISLSGTSCPGVESTISESAAASVSSTMGNFPITYTWSYTTNSGSTWTVIPGATGNTLKYSDFQPSTSYQFKRTAVCALGEASAVTGTVNVPSVSYSISPASGTIGLCKETTTFTVSGVSSCSWKYNGNVVGTGTPYTPSYADFVAASGSVTILCTAVVNGCSVTKEVPIEVSPQTPAPQTFVHCGDLLTDICGNTYATKLMADGRCWMVEDLRTGTCDNSTFGTYYQGSVKGKIGADFWGVCIASTQPGAGHLYNWQAAMNSANAVYNTNGNPSGNVNGNSPTQHRGICPEGWHLPSGGSTGEFQQLFTALGSDVSKIYPGTSTDGWLGVLGGYGYGSSVNSAGSNAYYWSSTYYNTNYAYTLYFNSGGVWPQDFNYKYYGQAVRCVKNY